jgi:hypothetical protein
MTGMVTATPTVKGRLKTSHLWAPQNQPVFRCVCATCKSYENRTYSPKRNRFKDSHRRDGPPASSRQQREASGVQGAAMSPLVAVRMPRKTCRMPSASNHTPAPRDTWLTPFCRWAPWLVLTRQEVRSSRWAPWLVLTRQERSQRPGRSGYASGNSCL